MAKDKFVISFPLVYYEQSPIKIMQGFYPEGYWIGMEDSPGSYSNYFMDKKTFENLVKLDSTERVSEMKWGRSSSILNHLKEKKINLSDLFTALDKVKQRVYKNQLESLGNFMHPPEPD